MFFLFFLSNTLCDLIELKKRVKSGVKNYFSPARETRRTTSFSSAEIIIQFSKRMIAYKKQTRERLPFSKGKRGRRREEKEPFLEKTKKQRKEWIKGKGEIRRVFFLRRRRRKVGKKSFSRG